MELKLSKKTKIYPIINICNLKKYNGPSPDSVDGPSLESEMKEYEVGAITDEKDDNEIFQIK